MRRPDYLKEGDKIGIAATARKVSQQEMQSCIYILESWGLEVVTANQLYEAENQFAGSDTLRAQGLQDLIDNEEIKAILFARGGYGTVRIVDMLDFSRFTQNPKWLIGYSDITVLHAHVNSVCDIETLHATMAINFIKDNRGVEALKKTLFGKLAEYTIAPNQLNIRGTGQGTIVGGNLSLLYSMKATVSDLNTKDCILFIEDLDEYLYHIDRMMMNLKRSGMLAGLKGLLVGGMTSMNDNEIPFGKTAEEIIADVVAEYGYPVCFDFPAGHIKGNMPLIMGSEVQLTVAEEGAHLKYIQ